MTTKPQPLAMVCFIVGILGVLIICFVAFKAKAERAWPHSEFSTPHVVKSYKPRRHIKRHKIAHRRHRKPRVKAWRRITKPRLATGCKPTISVVGDQAATKKGARAQAQKAFAQEARYRVGERYADLRFAQNILYSCVYSSIPNVANRATEAIGVNTRLNRCSISADPCIAPVVK